MNDLPAARQQIALNFVLFGLGISFLFIPNFLLFFDVPRLLRLLSLVCFPGGFYVSGLGVAGIIEGGVRLARGLQK